jgi:UDP-2-acetamido-2,6-beta-L-arabino-hexul-4-ose reductase
MKKIVITGANGLLGWHSCVRLHAPNCAAAFSGNKQSYEIVALGRAEFTDDHQLTTALKGADAVLHFAGVNRAEDHVVEAANPAIAERLLWACRQVEAQPHIVYANSTHAENDTIYGKSKRTAGEKFAGSGYRYTDIVLPHIFGECARPYYNNVTATLIDQINKGESTDVNPDGVVNLLHAGEAADIAIEAVVSERMGTIRPESNRLSVPELYRRLKGFHHLYQQNIYPVFDSVFTVQLFNSYRSASYPNTWPRELKMHRDDRGVLFEAVKGGSGGQTFMSRTKSGVTRGDHFHLNKVERFLVIQGEAVIRIRRVFDDKVLEFVVDGEKPQVIDMPTMHVHSIENTGTQELVTLFWVHEIFDPQNPDTFAEPVLR